MNRSPSRELKSFGAIQRASYHCPYCRGVLLISKGKRRFECQSCGEIVVETAGESP